MMNATSNIVAGVCHPKAENANLPPPWLEYAIMQDLNACDAGCRASEKFWMDFVPLTKHKSPLLSIPLEPYCHYYGLGIERCRSRKVGMAAETPIDRLLCSTA
jgi:hypothetical protein